MKYFIKQKVFTLKDKFNITDEQQNTLLEVTGKMFSITNKLSLTNPTGDEIYKAQKKLFRIFAEYIIMDPTGNQVATVKRRFGLRPKFSVFAEGKELVVQGNFIGHSFTVSDGGRTIVSITKKLFSFGDSYVIDVQDDYNKELYLFITVIIDQIIEEAEAKRNGRD
jgi:uncharacterized protein YxjI